MSARIRSPLPWLAGLLAVYLAAPLIAFLVRLGQGVPAAPGVGSALLTSVLTATVASALIALLGIPLAYLLARAGGRLAGAVTVIVALPLALPPLMSGILMLYLVGPYTALGRLFGGDLTDTWAGIVIAQTFVAAPFLVVAARGAFAAVDPALEEMAATLGHRRVARFLKVALPAAWPGVQAGLLLAWLRSFGEFGATVILAYHPYSLPVFTFVQFGSTGLQATMLPVAAALGAALIFLAAAQVHARRPRRRARLPPARPPTGHGATPLGFSLRHRLRGFSLELDHPEGSSRLALLGPSGAGKTLTLRLLAGLAAGECAQVQRAGTNLEGLPAERRDLGYVPQHSALLPRRTVWQQVNFAPDADPAVAAWWLEKLGLTGLEDRLPDELSGGQQRRVALARALARDPAVILLDEPFSALDAPVRARLAREVRRVQREVGLSTVLVTHDPEEAALLAEEIIVLDDGRALQQGSVAEVLSHPSSPEVARLVGLPNTHGGVVVGRDTVRTAGGIELMAAPGNLPPGSPVQWMVRPEDVVLGRGGRLPVEVLDVVAWGGRWEVTVSLAGDELTVRAPERPDVAPRSQARIDLPADAVTVWA